MDLMLIENTELAIREYNGQRVVTFKDIDAVHQRPYGTARRNFNKHKKYFVENEDYYVVTHDELNVRNSYIGKIPPKGITLLTKTGYLMIVKSFTDDLSWSVQRALVNSYFCKQETAQNRVESKISDYMISDKENFYERNKDAIWAICNERGIKPRELYHQILTILSDKYNLEGAKRHYIRRNGAPPEYIMDVIDFIPELSETADRIIGRIFYNMTKE